MFGRMYGPYRWPMYGPMSPFGALFFFLAALFLGIAVLYVLTLRRALVRCAPHNRAIEPNTAWLLFIPLFDLFWAFILYPRISESLEREYRERGLSIEPNPAKSLGLTLAILHACSLIPIVDFFSGIAGFIVWIIYWSKIASYSNRLEAAGASSVAASPAPPWAQPPQAGSAAPSIPEAQAATRYCAICGGVLHSGERYCAHCGTPVP